MRDEVWTDRGVPGAVGAGDAEERRGGVWGCGPGGGDAGREFCHDEGVRQRELSGECLGPVACEGVWAGR